MIIKDRIYGQIRIENQLIIDLINSAPMQRLKKISQDGALHFIQPVFDANRFEHSVGTWYLSKIFKRPIEEQVACLIHDIPHTAFSHVIDLVMDDKEQEYHDKFLDKIVYSSEIPRICKRHGIDIEHVLNKDNFPLLDNKVPGLSFDRWDYFMRDGYIIGMIPEQLIKLIIASAQINNDEFYFEDVRVASQLCVSSLLVARTAYASATSHGAWFLLGNVLKIAMEKKIITEDDIFSTDEHVWQKIQKSNNNEILKYLERLKEGNEFKRTSVDNADFHGSNKARYIDPLVKQGNKYLKVSQVVVGLSQYIDDFIKDCKLIAVVQG